MGLVQYTNIEDGQSADANVWNSRYGDILAQLNGNLDAQNIRKGSITRKLLSSDALSAAWPVGSIYITVEDTNPGSLLGGQWVKFATGRTLVGLDAAQTEFNEIEKTGGHKLMQAHTHTGTTNSAGNHTHTYSRGVRLEKPIHGSADWQHGFQDSYSNQTTSSAGAHTHSFTTASRGGGDSENLQPYIVVHMWKRVS